MNVKKLRYLLLLILLVKANAEGEECIISKNKQGETFDNCASLEKCVENICVHKEIFPLTFREVIGTSLTTVISGFANIGGKGGGALLSPILLVIFNYGARKAVMLTYILSFGGSLGNFLNVAFQRNINTEKPVILYDFALIAVPLMFMASNIGVLLNRMIAPILIVCLLFYMLITGIPKIYNKAKVDYDRELPNEANQALKEGQEMIEFEVAKQTEGEVNQQFSQGLQVMLEEEKTSIPKKKITFLLVVVAFVLLTFLVQGSHRISSIIGIEYCSLGYWLCYLVGLIGCFLFYQKGRSLVEGSLNSDVGPDRIKYVGSLGFTTGFLRGLVGTSGITNPMLSLGIEAQDMAATLGLMAVLTSFINLTQAFLYEGISVSEILFFFTVSFVGSYVISAGLYRMINFYKRPSLILFIILCIQTLHAVILPFHTIYEIMSGDSKMFNFHSVC